MRHSWYYRARNGSNVWTRSRSILLFQLVDKYTKYIVIPDNIEFYQLYLPQPLLTPKYRITHALSILTCSLKNAPSVHCNSQISVICSIVDLFGKWLAVVQPMNFALTALPTVLPTDPRVPSPSPRVTLPDPKLPPPAPRALPKAPRVSLISLRVISSHTPRPPVDPSLNYLVSHRTRSHTMQLASYVLALTDSSHSYSPTFIHEELSVLDIESGKSLEYRQLRSHTKYSKTWN